MALTNEVLQERIDQQHAQVIRVLTRVDDKLTELNGSVKEMRVHNAEHDVRLGAVEDCNKKLKTDIENVRQHTWKIVVVIAAIIGGITTLGEKLLALMLP